MTSRLTQSLVENPAKASLEVYRENYELRAQLLQVGLMHMYPSSSHRHLPSVQLQDRAVKLYALLGLTPETVDALPPAAVIRSKVVALESENTALRNELEGWRSHVCTGNILSEAQSPSPTAPQPIQHRPAHQPVRDDMDFTLLDLSPSPMSHFSGSNPGTNPLANIPVRSELSKASTSSEPNPLLRTAMESSHDSLGAYSNLSVWSLDSYESIPGFNPAMFVEPFSHQPSSDATIIAPVPFPGTEMIDDLLMPFDHDEVFQSPTADPTPDHPMLSPSPSSPAPRFHGQRFQSDPTIVERSFRKDPTRRTLLSRIVDTRWFKEQTMEPLFQSPADDVTHGLELPLRPFKDSIYKAFVAKEGQCMFGDVEKSECKKIETRIQRALGHVRGHLGHRPFVCDGCIRCNTRKEYVYHGRRISYRILTSFLFFSFFTGRHASSPGTCCRSTRMCLRRGRSVPCVDNVSAGQPSTDISRRGMVKHDWTTRQTSPPHQLCSNNLPLRVPSEGLDYRLILMVVLYRRANRIG